MSKITTEDCKNFIKNHFGLTSTVNIKRDRKYKDGNGDYIRVFTFDGATCLIKEDINGEISLITENELVAKSTVTSTTSSNPQEFDAKKFLKKGIKSLENYNNGDSMDDFIKATNALTKEQKFQVANQFTFFFPDETYYNELDYVTNGLDTLMISNASGDLESFCFTFIDCFNTDLDLYVSDILTDMLPDYLDKMDEYNYQLFENSKTRKITIREMIKILEDLGFNYKNNADWEDNQCMLAKLKLINAEDVISKPVKTESVQDFNAKRFLKKHIKKLEEDEGDDDEEEALSVFMKETARLSPENKLKVANEFCFYFPYETYSNMTKFIVNGLDTPMIFGKETLCVIFYDSVDSEPDLLVSHILKGILPEYFHKVDEYHFEIKLNEITKNLNIRDMIELLEHYGFTYKSSTEYLDTNGCMLKKLNLK